MQNDVEIAPTHQVLRKRFELERCLGRGSMGVVHVAHDHKSNRRVALKMLLADGPDELYQIKKEFRALAGIAAPNLVRLYEMHAEDPVSFFTMELIEGLPFSKAYVPAEPSRARVEFARLRDGIAQLTAGLVALHEHSKLHRDIKPTNVLVENGGRVVLVDFGLAHDLESYQSRQSQLGAAAGTFAYMSPEQAWGRPLSPAADWYSMGVMLYEMLTGVLPPNPLQSTDRSGARPPLYPSALESETPDDLDRLVFGLLQELPEARPGPGDIAAILHRAAPTLLAQSEFDQAARRIVGRHLELESLEREFQQGKGRFVAARVEGPSGIGKTALVQHFLASLEAQGKATVLRATCHPCESLPYKAFDGIIDDIVRGLARDRPDRVHELLPPGSDLLAKLFPVFRRMCEPAGHVAGDPHEVRRRAFDALRELLRRMTRRQRIVLWIDDLQWGDRDSVALLKTLLRPEDCPPVFLVVSHRDEPSEIVDDVSDVILEASLPRSVLHSSLAPLSFEESRDLAVRLLGGAESPESAQVAREAEGDPLLVTELARFLAGGRSDFDDGAPLSLSRVVWARVEGLPQTARRILRMVALAGQPLVESIALGVAPVDVPAEAAVGRLLSERLLAACIDDGDSAVDCTHARIREAIVEPLSPDERRELHRELAQLLEARAGAEPERFVEHYALAGELRTAAARAIAAAERASAAMAFDKASRLYMVAIDLRSSNLHAWDLHERLGAALVSAGKGGAGATRLEAAARALHERSPNDIRVLQLKRRAAEQYLRSGMHHNGLSLLREVMAEAKVRYPSSAANALASMLVHRVRLGDQHKLENAVRDRQLSPMERERLEVCWTAGVGLSVFDMMRAAYFQVRHALMARDAGDIGHLSRSMATAGLLEIWEGGSRRVRSGRALLHAGRRLADRTGDPNIRAHSAVMGAVSAYYEARYEDALEMCEQGERLCREECSSGAWELTNFQVLKGYALACLGKLRRLRDELPRVLREARERDDRYCLVTARLGSCNMGWIAAGEPGLARSQVEDALAGPFPSSYAWQIYQGAFALGQVDLYDGDPQAARHRLERAWGELKSRQMLRFMATRVEMLGLRARAALRVAADQPRVRSEMLGFVDHAVKLLRKEDAPWVDPFADAIGAGAKVLRGDRGGARLLEQAALGFDHFKLAGHAASARYQAARVDRDEERIRRACEEVSALGVASPAPFANMLVPAFGSDDV